VDAMVVAQPCGRRGDQPRQHRTLARRVRRRTPDRPHRLGVIGPCDPVDEVAVTAWYCAQLFDDDVAERVGLPPAATRANWFRSFLDGYGLPRAARADLVDHILRFVITDNGWYARTQGFTRESRDGEGLWTLAWQSRAALWTLEHRGLLTRAALR
jgi:hypothetical protein